MVKKTTKAEKPAEEPTTDKNTLEKADEKTSAATKQQDDKDEDLSEEDQQLKGELLMLVERLTESSTELHKPALENVRSLIRTSTSSMTSVPKPLKFLRPHYTELEEVYTHWSSGENKHELADILSVLGMTYAEDGRRDSLKYRLLGSNEDPGLWGHEYVKHLSAEIGLEYTERSKEDELTDDLLDLAMVIVPYFLKHNAEADAVDLLLELEAIDKLPPFVDKETYTRVCLYIVSCVNFLPPPEDIAFLETARTIYRAQQQLPEALKMSMQTTGLFIARQKIHLECEDEQLQYCLTNAKLSEHFLGLARELDVMEPKLPADIYKTHLENTRYGTANVDSATQNLASTYVNAFVNAAFSTDRLVTPSEETSNWIFNNKDYGKLAAAASIGLVKMWDIDMGLSQIDKYLESEDSHVKAGAVLAIGILNSGVRHESDPALALLSEYVTSEDNHIRTSAVVGLGIAYAGTQREEAVDLLLPLVSDTEVAMSISSLATLAIGQVMAGSCNGELASQILETMMGREEAQLNDPFAKFMALGLALLFLGKQEESDVYIETLKAIEHPIGKQAVVLATVCSYAGTGNVLKVQEMLHTCNDHLDPEKESDTHQAFAVLGVALISMGEDVGSEMSLRAFNHLMHYGEPVIRRAVPLALGLLCASNPLVGVLDTLSKYSHDNDVDVALNAIFAMGLVGAGTNNARLAQMLRQLASYYYKEPNCLLTVRIAQGLVHMGKGTMTINPYYANRSIMSTMAYTDAKHTILSKAHYLLYNLACAMYPRFLITLDERLNTLPVTVRVGQAVDVVGQAGRPKAITGFQTHTTPVLLAHSERAELATEEYLSLTPDLEGFVVLQKNPNYMEEEKE
ncbi:26S proteasome regulatory complex, non-ATPase subcomplex, Rpn1 subunit [Syncephalis fuscata]|nr:26S proteasome regulatory complex, non-ATPase subcomplex, Rpn1 subunit [Syncephalis fuscata]